ncbi:MAG: ATP-binding protein [Deltaproteobacteria bacterium]|nr:MAG: ATP-binding protein [Deltaproteobacteria bacterium]
MASTGWGGDERGRGPRSPQQGEAPPGAAPLPREAISFAIERQRHAGFVGRAALLARLDQQLINDASQRWVVVTGGPGMGKSALLAAWLTRREAAGDTVPHHFIRRGWANWDDPEALVGSLVTQIEARCPDAREPEADARLAAPARLAAALQRVSERTLVPRGERLVLLIDGLDEYDPRPGSLPGDPLAAFLPYALPPGVSVLCASRPRHPYVRTSTRSRRAACWCRSISTTRRALRRTTRRRCARSGSRPHASWAWTRSSSPRRWSAPVATWSTRRCCTASWRAWRPSSVGSRTFRAASKR